jgi:hypothetical protein
MKHQALSPAARGTRAPSSAMQPTVFILIERSRKNIDIFRIYMGIFTTRQIRGFFGQAMYLSVQVTASAPIAKRFEII